MKIIDNHTHLFNKEIYEEYAKKHKDKISKSIVLSWHHENLEDVLNFVNSKKNLFFVGNVDMNKNVFLQIKDLEKLFKKNKNVGIKLYPGYQYFYSNDKKIKPIADLCVKFNKPLIFHMGDVWDEHGNALLKYSHPSYIDDLANMFPKCKIIISHFGFPYMLETANIVSKNENVYTDISGVFDVGTNKDMNKMIKQYVKDLKRILNYYPDIKNKIMFGTDYSGETTPLNAIVPYIKVVKKVFSKKEQENVFYKTAEIIYGLE